MRRRRRPEPRDHPPGDELPRRVRRVRAGIEAFQLTHQRAERCGLEVADMRVRDPLWEAWAQTAYDGRAEVVRAYHEVSARRNVFRQLSDEFPRIHGVLQD